MTLKAMKKIDKIRVAREARHHQMRLVFHSAASWHLSLVVQLICRSYSFIWKCHRMKGKKAMERQAAITELEKSIDLVKAPASLQQDPQISLPKIKVNVSQSQPLEERMEE